MNCSIMPQHAGENAAQGVKSRVPAKPDFMRKAPEMVRSGKSGFQSMLEKMTALKGVELPTRLADRQEDFDTAVQELDAACAELAETVTGDDREKIEAAVEKVHTAYQNAEKIFD